ncbi:MAG: LysR family transcriptional regulator [Mariprofundaceae bacterium]
MIEIRHIRHILALAEHQNFARAAASLFMTQPALTKSIQKVEEQLGVKLFDRTKRHVLPTPFGEVIIKRGKGIIAATRGIEREIDLMNNVQVGSVTIAINPPYADIALGAILQTFTQRYPSININIDIGIWSEKESALKAGDIDFFIGPINDISADHIYQTTHLQEMVAWCFCRSGHPILKTRLISNDQLMEYQFARPPIDREVLHLALPETDQEQHQTIVCAHYSIIRSIVANSDIISAGTMTMIEREINDGLVVPILKEKPLVTADEGIIHIKHRSLSPAAQGFIDCAQAACSQLHQKELALREKFGVKLPY